MDTSINPDPILNLNFDGYNNTFYWFFSETHFQDPFLSPFSQIFFSKTFIYLPYRCHFFSNCRVLSTRTSRAGSTRQQCARFSPWLYPNCCRFSRNIPHSHFACWVYLAVFLPGSLQGWYFSINSNFKSLFCIIF